MGITPRSAVIVSAVDPYPSDSGKSVVIAGFLRHLRGRLGADAVHYVHVGEPIDDLAPFEGVRVHEAGAAGRRDKLRAVALEAGLRRRSLQETFMNSPRVAARVRGLLDEIGADLEIVDTVRLLQHVGPAPSNRARRVLYLDDLFSVRYRRMLASLEDGTTDSAFDPLGQFARNVPARLRWLTRTPASRNALLRLEARRIDRAERRAAADAEVSVLLNDEEAAHLRSVSGGDVRVLPPWVLQRPTDHTWDGTPEFVFAGLLSLPHNHDGLQWFLDEGMPVLLAERPDARLHVIGRDAPAHLLESARRFGDRVIVHGFVPDLDEAMTTRCALVNTLRFGSGVKIKTLDALSRGLPVVATDFGAEGISTTSVPGLTIVKDAAEAGRVLARLADPEERRRHSEGARDFYRRTFADDVVMAAYDEVFGTRP